MQTKFHLKICQSSCSFITSNRRAEDYCATRIYKRASGKEKTYWGRIKTCEIMKVKAKPTLYALGKEKKLNSII